MKRKHPYKVALGERANTVLVTIVKRYRVEPEFVLRAICETDLYDASNDNDVAETIAYDADLLKTTGTLDGRYWKDEPARHDGLTVDRSLAQEEAPDDVPVYQPPQGDIRQNGKHSVTLEFSEAGYAGLLLMKAYDRRASVEEVILRSMAGDVTATLDVITEDWMRSRIG